MKEYLGKTFSMSLIFASAAYLICNLFVDKEMAPMVALFTFVVFFIVLFMYMSFYTKSANKIDLSGIDNISFKGLANYYTDRLIGNGTLITTPDRIVFIPVDNKKASRVEYGLQEVQKITYDKIFKHIKGIKVELNDGSTIGFGTTSYKEVLKSLNMSN